MRTKVEQELERLTKEGIIELVQYAEWAAPIVPVLKSDKTSVRICGDFKLTVNQASKLDRYPIPKVEDLFATLAGGKSFTKLDLSQAYQQIELEETSKNYVVINTNKGLFRYTRLPYGVSSAPGLFQRAMENLLQGLPHVVVYIDDILVTGDSNESHLANLREVLIRLEDAGLRLKKNKCVFMAPSVTYLGHKIDGEGLHPIAEKVKAVNDAPNPRNVQELKSYLGLLNYYGKFLPNLSTELVPLYKLLRAEQKWKWSERETAAFQKSKDLLTSSQLLIHFDPQKELILSCDASAYGIGAVLAHRMSDGSEKPIGYVSRTLSAAEKNYSQLEKEGLSCVFGVKRFHSYLYGHQFSLLTDHKPLLSLFNESRAVPPQASARIQRWALTLAMYEYSLKFKSTKQHGNADAMSRLPLPDTVTPPLPPETVLLLEFLEKSPVTAKQVRLWTRRDPILTKVSEYIHTQWPTTIEDNLKPYGTRQLELSNQDGCILWGNRVVIPPQGRLQILQELHEGHPGVSRMKALARQYVWWPCLDKDIEEKVQCCSTCQSNRVSPPVAPLHPWEWPSRPWSRVHLDFAGPFLGHMFLIMVDAHSKWIEVHVMASSTSSATIENVRTTFAQLGIPQTVVTDNGSCFVSAEFKQFLTKNGIHHITSAPYHPSSNGLAERAVQTVKQGLKKLREGSVKDRVARFLFAYRNTPQSTTGNSPAELLFGRKLNTRFDQLKPDVFTTVQRNQQRQKFNHDNHSSQRSIKKGDLVYTRNYSAGQMWLPGKIVKQTGPVSFLVKLEEGRVWRRHINQIRKRFENESSNPTITNDGSILNLIDFPIESVPYPTVTDTQEPPRMENSTLYQNETGMNHTSNNQRRSNRNRRPPVRYSPEPYI